MSFTLMGIKKKPCRAKEWCDTAYRLYRENIHILLYSRITLSAIVIQFRGWGLLRGGEKILGPVQDIKVDMPVRHLSDTGKKVVGHIWVRLRRGLIWGCNYENHYVFRRYLKPEYWIRLPKDESMQRIKEAKKVNLKASTIHR